MSPRRVLLVMGTRPEAIKLAPVLGALRARPADFHPIVCSTGQHREMLDQVFELFDITPDIDLRVMTHNQGLAGLTGQVLTGIDGVLERERPDLVLVQGDTTSTFVGALAAFYRRIPVGHVEAGLRTGNRFAPFPEEINRTLAGHVADIHFAPTERARQNLLREGIAADSIHVTGNTGIDAFLDVASRPEPSGGYAWSSHAGPLVAITAHRRESFGDGFARICAALRRLTEARRETLFVYPVHRNPNVKGPVERELSDIPNMMLVEPMPYLPFCHLLKRATIILTDSGGIQEEAPSLQKPVLVLRDTTERPEAVEAGTAILAGTDVEKIVSHATRLLGSELDRAAMVGRGNPFGDGHAADRIADLLARIQTRRLDSGR